MIFRVSARWASVLLLFTTGACRCSEQASTNNRAFVYDAKPGSSDEPATPFLKSKPANMPTPTLSGAEVRSFSSPFASSAQASQVNVRRRRFIEVARRAIAPLGNISVRRTPPFSLIVSPDGRHGVLTSRSSVDLLEASGVSISAGTTGERGDAVAFDDVVFYRGRPQTWDGKAVAEEHEPGANVVVRRIEGGRHAIVANNPLQIQQDVYPPRVRIQGGRRDRSAPSSDWLNAADGWAAAAIGADFTAVLATDHGVLQVWPPVADAQGWGLLAAERNIGVTAKWVSIIPPYIMLVAPDGAGSKLMTFSGDTTPVYSVSVPFEVRQPAIAGGGKRVYLAGKGLAALDDGKVTWMHASDEGIYATAFGDRSLAVATGKRLDFLKPDGTVDQTFSTEEPLVAPPAITADGTVWAASADAIYIAR